MNFENFDAHVEDARVHVEYRPMLDGSAVSRDQSFFEETSYRFEGQPYGLYIDGKPYKLTNRGSAGASVMFHENLKNLDLLKIPSGKLPDGRQLLVNLPRSITGTHKSLPLHEAQEKYGSWVDSEELVLLRNLYLRQGRIVAASHPTVGRPRIGDQMVGGHKSAPRYSGPSSFVVDVTQKTLEEKVYDVGYFTIPDEACSPYDPEQGHEQVVVKEFVFKHCPYRDEDISMYATFELVNNQPKRAWYLQHDNAIEKADKVREYLVKKELESLIVTEQTPVDEDMTHQKAEEALGYTQEELDAAEDIMGELYFKLRKVGSEEADKLVERYHDASDTPEGTIAWVKEAQLLLDPQSQEQPIEQSSSPQEAPQLDEQKADTASSYEQDQIERIAQIFTEYDLDSLSEIEFDRLDWARYQISERFGEMLSDEQAYSDLMAISKLDVLKRTIEGIIASLQGQEVTEEGSASQGVSLEALMKKFNS